MLFKPSIRLGLLKEISRRLYFAHVLDYINR
jgi:hypothetical protein